MIYKGVERNFWKTTIRKSIQRFKKEKTHNCEINLFS